MVCGGQELWLVTYCLESFGERLYESKDPIVGADMLEKAN
jgi:hypothetical protein